jgi:DNA repair protein RadC
MAQHGFNDVSPSLFPMETDEVVAPLGGGAGQRLPSYIGDHRKRLRTRFIEGGAQAMPDYELLELVLFRAIPRQDVKPLARLLLDTFGDFNRVMAASPMRLMLVKGVGESVVQELKIVEAAAQRMMRARDASPHSNFVERAAGLLPHRHVAPRNRKFSRAVSGPQECADRR